MKNLYEKPEAQVIIFVSVDCLADQESLLEPVPGGNGTIIA